MVGCKSGNLYERDLERAFLTAWNGIVENRENVRDYKDVERTQIINISSCGGYTIVPTAVTYCAAKFYVSTFTEGLARELEEAGAKMSAKVLAPAATKTEFGMVANNVSEYDYDKSFGTYHTSRQIAGFLLELYDSGKVVGMEGIRVCNFWR